MALKKPSDFFGNNKTPLDEVKESYDSARPEKIEKVSEAFDAFKSNLNHIQSLSDFTSTFDSFKNNLEKVESVSGEVSEIREEIKTLIKKEDLDSAMMAQLLFVEESITNIESKISSINGKTVDSIKEDFANLSDTINGFLSVDVPKYKKLIAESEVKTDSRFATFKEGIEENLDKIKVDVNKEVETALESIESINENTINIVKAEVKETVGDVNKKVNELVEKELPKYKKLFAETEVKTEEKINSAIHSYKSTIESLSERVKEFTEEEIPKYSNLLIETKLKSEKEVKKLEEEVLSRVKTLSEKVESLSEDVEQKTFERVESLQDVVKEYKEEIESISKRYETLQKDFTGRVVHEDKKLSQYSKKLDEFSKRFSFIEETLTEDVRELKENLETNTSKFYTELKSEIDNVEQNIAQTVKDLEVNIVINETHLKKQNEYIGNIQEEVKEVLDKLQLDVLEKKNAQLVERINHVEEVFSKINEKTLLTEDNPTLPGDPSTNNSGDPLTPLDQKFVTLDQLQNHYRIFINRIQQQIATIGGGGEVRLEFLDDVDRDSVKVDGKFLKYQASSGKFIGADASGDVGAGGTWATFDSNTGITTTKKVKIDNDLEVTGVTTSTGGFVGNVTGTATGLSGTPDISIRNITGVAATFTGILTYEDVTNIDSLGLGTFRNGLIVQGTGTTSTTLNVSGVSTFTGTTNHTFTNITRDSNGTVLQLRNTSNANSAYVDQRFVIDGQSRAGFRGQIHGANLGGQLRFYTAADTQVLTERAVIDHQGRFGINQSSPAYTLDLGESSSTIRLVSENFGTAIRVGAGGGSNDVTLIRVDGDSGNHDGESNSGQYGFSLKYLGSGSGNANAFAIFSDNQTAGTQVQAFTVLQDGKIGINQSSPAYTLDLGESASTIRLVSEDGGTAIRIGPGGDSNDITLIRVDGAGEAHDGESDSAKLGFSLKYLGSGSGNANAFAIFSDNQTGTQVQAFTVLQDGTVGINSTIPSERLDVGGTTKTEQLNVSGISTFSGDISIADKIIHTGDTNTAIRFPADDTFTVETAGSERLRITSAGNVGIGTNNPLQKLHIVDDTSANIYLETKNSSTSSTSGIYFRTSDSSTQDAFFKTAIVLEDDGTSFARGKLHILQDNTADDSNATLSDSVVTIDQSGNVGINESSPDTTLDINSDGTAGFIRVTGARTDNGNNAFFSGRSSRGTIASPVTLVANDTIATFQGQAHDGSNYLQAGRVRFGVDSISTGNLNSNLQFMVSNNGEYEAMRITSDGSVGIGTTGAEHKVTVFDTGYSGVTIKSNRTTTTENIGGLDFKTQNTAVARIQSLVDGSIKFRNSSSLTERLRITSDGDVGIGTTSAEHKVAIFDDEYSGVTIKSNRTTATSNLGGLDFKTQNTAVARIQSLVDGSIKFRNSSSLTERLRIDSGGDIFINRTTQLTDAKVSVQADSGQALIAGQMNTNSGTSTVLQTYAASGQVSSNISVDNANKRLILKGATAEGLRIDSNGDVGVGIDDPQEKLHVARTVMVTGDTPQIRLNANDSDADDDDRTMLGQATSAGNFVTTAVDNDTILRGTATGNLLFGVGTAEKLRITSAGLVGIGSDNPQQLLDIASTAPNIRLTDTVDGHSEIDGNAAELKFNADKGNTKADSKITFFVDNGEKLRIDSSGRLLIGTTTEGAALADNLTVADSADCGITIRSGSSNYGSIYFSDATSGGGEYAGQIEYLHSVDRFTFYAGVSAIMRVHSDKIDVLGHTETDTLNVSGISTFANTVSVAETIEHTGDTNTSISFPSNDYIRLTTSGSSRLNATSNGYILLGTNSEPSGGDAHALNARLLIQGRIGNTADSGRLNLQRGSSASNGSSIGSITFTDNSNNAYARIETQADDTPGTDDYPGKIVFSTTPDGSASPTESLHINSSGQTNIGGSSGVVGSKFNIFNGSDTENILGITGADESSEYAAIGVNGGNAVITGGGAGSTNTGILFRTAASGTETERLRITSSGNVGINSTVPSEELDVGGTTQTQILKVNGSSTFNGNINMFSTAPQLIMKEDGSSHGDTNWALVRDADSFSIRWNNASPYAFRASTSGGSVTSVFLRQSGLEVNASGTVIQGSLSKGSGSFKIDHPLVGMSTTHNLVHSFIEGPQADLIYRGKVDLVNGSATVNIDTAGRMTEGTFVALCTNVQCFTTNETDWTAIKGSVSGNTLTVLAQDSSCTATVSWMVVGERKDQHMIDTNWTDDNGRVITEPPKTD